jgi:hypothetical protein
VEPLSKIYNRGSVLFGFLASFFALLKIGGEIIAAFVDFGESL